MTILVNSTAPKEFQIFNNYIHPNIASIVIKLFRSPEIQRLSVLTEDNPYHYSENVLDHVQIVFANCQELLKFEFIRSEELRKNYLFYFNEVLDIKGQYKRNDLLFLASAVHDVGKGLKDEQGTSIAPGHEHRGAMIVPSLLQNFDLTSVEISIVQTLVDLHDTFNEIFCRANLTREPEKDILLIRQRQPLFYVELLLHILSDNAGVEIYRQWFEYFKNEILQRNDFLKI